MKRQNKQEKQAGQEPGKRCSHELDKNGVHGALLTYCWLGIFFGGEDQTIRFGILYAIFIDRQV